MTTESQTLGSHDCLEDATFDPHCTQLCVKAACTCGCPAENSYFSDLIRRIVSTVRELIDLVHCSADCTTGWLGWRKTFFSLFFSAWLFSWWGRGLRRLDMLGRLGEWGGWWVGTRFGRLIGMLVGRSAGRLVGTRWGGKWVDGWAWGYARLVWWLWWWGILWWPWLKCVFILSEGGWILWLLLNRSCFDVEHE